MPKELHGDARSEKIIKPPTTTSTIRCAQGAICQRLPAQAPEQLQVDPNSRFKLTVSHAATIFAPNPGLTQPLLPTGPLLDAHAGLVNQEMGKFRQHALIDFPE